MSKRIRTAISLLICAMMLLTQFAFAIEEAEVPAGAETAKETAAESEKAAPEEVKEEPAKEEAKPAAEAPKEEAKAEEEKKEDSAKEESKAEKKEPAKEETKAEQKKEEKKDSKPSFSDEAKINGVKVSVKAAEGIFPEGAKLSVEKVSKDNQKKVDKAVDEAREDNLNVAAVYSFDVKVLDENGKEIQPADKKKVDISFKLDEADDANLDATIYHLEDTKSGLKAEELKTKTDKDVVSAETNGFSYYTVEFTYNDLQYVMDGDSSVALADILKTVGLEGEVADVKVSNADIFSAEKKDDKWIVTAHKAFTSKEWMKVTIDGIEYEIVVTDAIPGDNVTSAVEMKSDEEKTGNFTIATGGVVLGPKNGTATIKNGTVINNAKNDKNGQYGSTNGSAFIARRDNSLQFNNVTINSGANTLVLNIWANCSITAENTTLKGSQNTSNAVPFLMIGGYPNGGNGALNFKGTSEINGAMGSAIGGNGSSVINVNDGTLTLKDSKIALKDGIKFVVKSGATLVLDNTVLDVSGCTSGPAIQVEEGGKLIVQNKSAINNYNNSGNSAISAKNATVELNDSVFDKNKGQWGGVLLSDGCDVTITNCKFTDNTGKSGGAINAVNSSTLNIKGSTFDGNNATDDAGGAIWMDNTTITVDGESKFINNIANKKGGAIHAQNNSTVTIDDGASFSENHAGSVTSTDTGIGGALCLNNCTTTIGSATFEKNGTYLPDNSEDDDYDANTGIYTQSGGAINASNGTLIIKGTTFKENVALDWGPAQGSGGAIHLTGTTMSIEGATFKDNAGQLYGGAVTLGVYSKTEIKDLDGTPTRFEGNAVLYGAEFAGGAICIHGDGTSKDAFLKMENAAIYGNHADGAGGGISTCQQGTSKVMVMDGAAIFDNEVGSSSPVTEAVDKKDVYIFRNGTASQDTSEIYDRMFNGGSHCWDNEELEDVQEKWAGAGTALIGKSNPTNTDVSNAKVIFTGNAAYVHPDESMKTAIASGGAISNNGLLQIGSDTQIRVYKEWNDNSDAAGKRLIDDDFVAQLTVKDTNGETVDLSADGIEVVVHKSGEFDAFTEFVAATQAGRTEKVTATEDNWVIDISGLPKEGWPYIVYESASGKPGEAVSEFYLPPAKTDPETDRELGFTGFKNTYVEGRATLEGTKTLVGRDLKEGEFEFILWNEKDEEIGRASCDADGKFTFDDITYTLKDYQAAKEYTYYITEVQGEDESVDYDTHKEEVSVKLTYTYGSTEINTGVIYKDEKKPEFVNEVKPSVKVTKVWDDKDDDAALRPESVDIKLLADGKDTGKVLTLGKDNNWKGEFTDLVKYDGDKEIKYSVEEVIEGNLQYYTVTVSGDAESGFTVTNKLEVLTEKESTGTKNWVGDEEGDRPESIRIQLLENGTPLEDVILEVVPDENGDWTYRFDGMPKYKNGEEIEYSVKELDVPEGYEPEADGFNLTNTYTEEKPDTEIDLKFKKKWDDENDADGIRPEKVTVRLMRDDEFTGDVLILTEEDNWRGAFEDLPIEDSNGKKYTYGFAEDEVRGYHLDKVESEGEYNVLVNKHEVSKKVKGAKTGDDTHAMNLLILLAACTAVLTAISIRRRKEQ